MGTYADSLLTEGEVVIRRERQHWLSLFLETRLSILLWVIAIVALLAVPVFHLKGAASDGLSLGALAIIAFGVVFFAWRWWHWQTEEYLITSRRLLKVEGIVNKRAADSNLEKINDAILEENLIGRMLDFGDPDGRRGRGRQVPDAQPCQGVQEGDADRQARAGGRSLLQRRRERAAASV